MMTTHTRTLDDGYVVKLIASPETADYHATVYQRRRKRWAGRVALPTFHLALFPLDSEIAISDAAHCAVFAARGW